MDLNTKEIADIILNEQYEYNTTIYRGIWQEEAANKIIELVNSKTKEEDLLERAELYKCRKCGKVMSWKELISGTCC